MAYMRTNILLFVSSMVQGPLGAFPFHPERPHFFQPIAKRHAVRG